MKKLHAFTFLNQKLLRCPLTHCFLFLVIYISIVHLFLLHSDPYKSVPKWKLVTKLYKHASPLLKYDKTLPKCGYTEVLSCEVTESTWGVPKAVNISTEDLINGSYTPQYCRPAFSVAILVPYRNRKEHLDVFLPNIHNFLRMQNIHYKLYLIEQQDDHPWNKGILFNVGAKQAIADGFPCLIFHDVDLLPLDHSNLYVCMVQPRHMSSCIDEFRFVLLYDIIFGGVVSIRSDYYKVVNGFSNKFDYWGGEDDEFLERILEKGLKMKRFPPDMSRYTLLHGHAPRVDNKNRWIIRAENRRTHRRGDGLDSVQQHVLKQFIITGHSRRSSDVHPGWSETKLYHNMSHVNWTPGKWTLWASYMV